MTEKLAIQTRVWTWQSVTRHGRFVSRLHRIGCNVSPIVRLILVCHSFTRSFTSVYSYSLNMQTNQLSRFQWNNLHTCIFVRSRSNFTHRKICTSSCMDILDPWYTDTRKNVHVVRSLQTNCYKSIHKLSTSCIRIACNKFGTYKIVHVLTSLIHSWYTQDCIGFVGTTLQQVW